MKLLVTGGAGFIGGNFIRYFLNRYPDCSIVNFDKPTYAGNLASLTDIARLPNYQLVLGDITNPDDVDLVFQGGVDVVVHFAAESHVDRSILNPQVFVHTNVLGTQTLLEAARRTGVQKFVHVSTDEVYGTLGDTGAFTEETPLQPNSPYAASKASADLLARAFYQSFQFPVVTTRCSNNYGPFQFPEKLIPLTILQAIHHKPILVYGDGFQIRDWLHVSDHVSAIDLVIRHGVPGEVYNIGGGNEWTNLDIVKYIIKKVGQTDDLIRFVQDRPGHDRRYAMNAHKIRRDLGWKPLISFDDGLNQTVEWYCNNEPWCNQVQTGLYRSYMALQYGKRLDERL